ncbi:MAG TPA: peptidylprolyl isomerase [Thermohalobaculum sp.]|nr:peptidylprolyl isomerase [Thermohalobaculum sp.]
MLKTLLGVTGLIVALLSATTAPSQTMFRPVAIVNDSAITGFDLSQRAQILVALGYKATDQEALRAESLERLIEDRLKLQEAARLSLSASADSINEGIEEFAKRTGVSGDELRGQLRAKGITEQALNDLVAADIVWGQVVRGRFSRRVEPGEAEIDAEIGLLQQRTGVSYRIAEIGLPATDQGRSNAQTEALAEKIYASLSQGGDFSAAVRTYSRAPSAERGGEVGWVSGDRLPPQLAEILGETDIGQISRPFRVAGGLSILKVLEKRADSADAIDANNQELRNRVRERLASQRTTRLAEGLLQELRRDALIELR